MSVSATPRRFDRPPVVSIVCPVYREAATLPEFQRRLEAALEPTGVDYEVIFVDDGSDDESLLILREMAAASPAVRVVALARNFGHQLAITAGLDHATGDATVVIDSDLQDPPEVIPEMIDRWRAGYDVVYGERVGRPGEPRLMLLLIGAFYRILGRLSETPLPTNVADFRLIDRRVRDVLVSMREQNRYIRGMIPWIGFAQTAVRYKREARHAGRSNYRLTRRIRLAFDAISSFSDRPLHLALGLGAVITTVALAWAVWLLIQKAVDPSSAIPGYTSLMVVVLFLGGIQLLGMGLFGAYLGRLYREAKLRPLYVVRELVNIDEGDPAVPSNAPLGPSERATLSRT